jgi:hypothetical protein
MGGLVFKKAFLLSQHNPAYQSLGQRFHTVYFLATPHYGADSAQFLKAMLKATLGGDHPYLSDITQDSPTTQSINDEFRHHASKLRIYSFYETKPTSILGIGDVLIVKKSSATMQLPEERIDGIQANHRGVCKYDTPSDPNYILVKNAIVETLDLLREKCRLVIILFLKC